MDRLVFGMRVLNITQSGTMIDGKPHLSHKNAALDMAGCDSGKDFWFAKSRMKCIGEMWLHNLKGERFRGYGTYAFTFVDAQGNPTPMRMADGSEKIVTLAMTHSSQEYVKSIPGKIYEVNQPVYEEGGAGAKGDQTYGNHIHLEISEGVTINKYYDKSLGVYRMNKELNPVDCFYILDGFTTVKSNHGLTFKHTDSVQEEDMSFKDFKAHKAETQKIIDAHCNDFTYPTAKDYLAKKGGYHAYLKSLGGVFAKYEGFTGKIKTYAELSEIGDYVWGLYDLWGVDYSNGCSYIFRENRYKAYDGAKGAYYPQEKPVGRFAVNYSAFSFANKNDLPTVDKMFSDCAEGGKYYAVTNCGQGVVQMLKKAGLCPADFPDPAEYPQYWKEHGYPYTLIKSTKDLRIGDVLYFFNKPIPNRATRTTLSNWESGGFHTAIVGEMLPDGYVLYDSGHAYTYYGQFRNFRKYTDRPYQWAEDWIGIRFDFGLTGGQMNGWVKENGNWYYYKDGKKLTGWQYLGWSGGTDWFYFDSNGVMLTGWQKLKWSKGESWFYFDPKTGAMVTGLQYLAWKGRSDWYLFDTSGAMLTGKQKAEIVLNNSGQLTGGKKI